MAKNNTTNANIPKGIDADGNAQAPSAYSVVRMECINQFGDVFDVFPIVKTFTITEELFSPVIVLNLTIHDNINFFEDFAISGQEQIHIELERAVKDTSVTQLINLKFTVKEYPNYKKSPADPNLQTYNIVAVSPFAYSSMLKRISRSIKGSPVNNIEKIFNDDLNVKTHVDSVCVSAFDGIITTQSPLKAIEWLRSKSFDESGSPFFAFSNISRDGVVLKSLKDILLSRDVFNTYEYRQFLTNKVNDVKSYHENASRILDMQSEIKLDKLEQAIRGGFASKTRVTDIATKSYTDITFDYSADPTVASSKLNKKESTRISSNRDLPELTQASDASTSYVSVNSNANYQGNPNSSSGPIQGNIARAKSFYANIEGISHQILVYGNFELNPGKKIKINIPKAKTNDFGEDELDESMSGYYIVSVVVHTFSDGVYMTKAKIIKDA